MGETWSSKVERCSKRVVEGDDNRVLLNETCVIVTSYEEMCMGNSIGFMSSCVIYGGAT